MQNRFWSNSSFCRGLPNSKYWNVIYSQNSSQVSWGHVSWVGTRQSLDYKWFFYWNRFLWNVPSIWDLETLPACKKFPAQGWDFILAPFTRGVGIKIHPCATIFRISSLPQLWNLRFQSWPRAPAQNVFVYYIHIGSKDESYFLLTITHRFRLNNENYGSLRWIYQQNKNFQESLISLNYQKVRDLRKIAVVLHRRRRG